MPRTAAPPKKAPAKKQRKTPLLRPAPARLGRAGVAAQAAAQQRAFCVAAIGASAGGFDAIRTFFDTMPADSGIAFVVIQHLHPTQKSLAAELFGRRTKMPVVQAEDGMRVEPDHAYTIPPNTYLSIDRGVLRLAPPAQPHGLRLTVAPAGTDAEGGRLFLVVFQDEPRAAPRAQPAVGDSELVRQLEDELRATKDDLQSSIERAEASNQELKISNEEGVSINEELQSINEELVSSKEELQSLNEELSTVNQQLHSKVGELESALADVKNLLASSEIATICIDRDFHIRWFTPAMTKVFNVMDSDLGRPVSDLAAALSGNALLEHAAAVLEKLTPQERELQLEDGRWYLRRIVPYRGGDEHIDGVVVTFVDITEARMTAQNTVEAQRKTTELLEQKVRERTVQLRALAVELSLAEERERRSLAQDLHDDLGQVLAIVKHKLTALHGRKSGAATAGELKNIEQLVDRANQSMRTLAFQLSPPVLHTLGLIPALEWLTEEMERVYGLKVRLSDDGAPKPLDETSRTTLFRAVRELLINVAKHAGTRLAEVSSLRAEDRVTLAVNDDGSGFDHQQALNAAPGTGGLGLVGLRERIEFIGGEMHVDSSPGAGTTITLIAPLASDAGVAAA